MVKNLFYACACVCLMNAILLNSYSVLSQTAEQFRVEIETDPLAYILHGYSLHIGGAYLDFKSSVGIYGIETPKFFLQNDAFSVYTSGFDFKTDYLFGDIKGFYTGFQLNYAKDRIELKSGQGEKDELRSLNIGVRTGYRFMFGKKENQYKGFYLTPWAALLYNPSASTVQQGTQEYRQASWIPFLTFHAGWRF